MYVKAVSYLSNHNTHTQRERERDREREIRTRTYANEGACTQSRMCLHTHARGHTHTETAMINTCFPKYAFHEGKMPCLEPNPRDITHLFHYQLTTVPYNNGLFILYYFMIYTYSENITSNSHNNRNLLYETITWMLRFY